MIKTLTLRGTTPPSLSKLQPPWLSLTLAPYPGSSSLHCDPHPFTPIPLHPSDIRGLLSECNSLGSFPSTAKYRGEKHYKRVRGWNTWLWGDDGHGGEAATVVTPNLRSGVSECRGRSHPLSSSYYHSRSSQMSETS